VAADHLGVGASSAPSDVDAVTLEAMARAAAAFAEGVGSRLPDAPLIGVGHSLGGCITILTQALEGTYGRIASLGFTHGAKDAVTADAAGTPDTRAAALVQAKAFFATGTPATRPRRGSRTTGGCTPGRRPRRSWPPMTPR
jgi:pimeloyl-ACP methyl ester carboxylesterase